MSDLELNVIEHKDVPISPDKHIRFSFVLNDSSDLFLIPVTENDLHKQALVRKQYVYTLVSVDPVEWLLLRGSKGKAGPKGINGLPGDVGEMGPQGPQGDKGPVGPQGPRGKVGPEGRMGPQGPIGDRGPQGPPADPNVSPPPTEEVGKPGAIWSKSEPAQTMTIEMNQVGSSSHVYMMTPSSMSQFNVSMSSPANDVDWGTQHLIATWGKNVQVNISSHLKDIGRSSLVVNETAEFIQINAFSVEWKSDSDDWVSVSATFGILVDGSFNQINPLSIKASSNISTMYIGGSYNQINPCVRSVSLLTDTSFVMDSQHSQLMTGYIGPHSHITMSDNFTSYWISSGDGLWGSTYCACPENDDYFYSTEPMQWMGIKTEL